MIRVEVYHAEKSLGECYVEALPPVGALVGIAGMWRVEIVVIYPAMPGSASMRGAGQKGVYHLFVVPAEGPS